MVMEQWVSFELSILRVHGSSTILSPCIFLDLEKAHDCVPQGFLSEGGLWEYGMSGDRAVDMSHVVFI